MLIRGADAGEERTSHGGYKRVMLRGGVLPNVTQAAVAALAAGERVEPHSHSTMYEVYYVLGGRAEYNIGGVRCEAGPGDLVIVPPGALHSLEVLEGPHRIFYWGMAT